MKFYAVRKGRTPGIYTTWEETEPLVKGFPRAEYKSFLTYPEAKSYLYEAAKKRKKSSFAPQNIDYTIYTDGSYNKSNCTVGYAAVILQDDVVIDSISGRIDDTPKQRNVTGELIAVLKALSKYRNGNILICHDYVGVAKFAKCEWKTNTPFTQWYVEKFTELKGERKVYFKRVPAHSGVTYNELADKLAREST